MTTIAGNGTVGSAEPFRLAGAVVQRLTVGHRRLLARMGFPRFRDERCGEVLPVAGAVMDKASEAKAHEALMAAVWLATRPLLEVRPSGRVAAAINSGTHARLFEEWEFELDGATLEQIPLAFAVAVEMRVVVPAVPAVEPDPVALPVSVEDAPEVEAPGRGPVGAEIDEECLSCQ